MDEYVLRMEKIIKRNLEIYGDLQKRIGKIKTLMKEESEAHMNVRGTFYFWLIIIQIKPMSLVNVLNVIVKQSKTPFLEKMGF